MDSELKNILEQINSKLDEQKQLLRAFEERTDVYGADIKRIDAKIDKVESKLNDKIDNVENKLNEIDSKTDKILESIRDLYNKANLNQLITAQNLFDIAQLKIQTNKQ